MSHHLVQRGIAVTAIALSAVGGGFLTAIFTTSSAAAAPNTSNSQLANKMPRQGEITKTPDGRCFVTVLSGGNGGPRWGYREVPCPPGY